MDIVIVTTVTRSATVCSHTCVKTSTQLVNCTVNKALVRAMPNVQQIVINVVHSRLTDLLLDNASYLVVNGTEVREVRWPQIWWNKSEVVWCHVHFLPEL